MADGGESEARPQEAVAKQESDGRHMRAHVPVNTSVSVVIGLVRGAVDCSCRTQGAHAGTSGGASSIS